MESPSKPLKEYTFGYDLQSIKPLQDYILSRYKNNQDFRMSIGYGDDIMNGLEIYNPEMLKDSQLKDLMDSCECEGNFEESKVSQFNKLYSLILEKAKKKAPKGVCWKGYKMVGMKKKGNKEVPNCVPNKN